ncbi:hypothetical protein GMJLKIPL_5716 [Methylobacterium isbiliense]|uniref:Uncharacterized protein n=1 Tax=Methylobacterium isbiliense TaxID=315478 RepID=A0ABQ4SPR6_9HYPH|nr:hypothetical protein GMJLKIPL_5716 [Methylobacterium isbiliense]
MGVHPRQKLACREGFDEVVVDPGPKALDARVLGRPCGQQDDRYVGEVRIPPQRGRKLKPVQPGHHDVGQDEIGPLPPRRRQRRLAVGDRLDHPTPPRQQADEIAAHVGIVIGQQNAGVHRLSRQGGGLPFVQKTRRLFCPLLGQSRKPAQRFLDERFGLACRSGQAARSADPVGREVVRPERHEDREGRAVILPALDRDGAAVQADQFLHQGEADAAPLVRSASRAVDPMEALEHARQFRGRDPDPGVADPQRGAAWRGRQTNGDAALKGEFEGVGEKIENNLLPHVAIHVDRL